MKKNILFIILCLLLISCNEEKLTTDSPKVMEVEVCVLDSTENILYREYLGKVEENSALSLSFPTGGVVSKIYVKTGDKVKEGEILAEVKNEDALNAFKLSNATLKQAEDGYNRLKKVYEEGAIAEVKWIEMVTNLEKAQSMQAISAKRLEDCKLKAPSNGTISEVRAIVGSNLLPAERIMTLMNLDKFRVSFTVPESEISSIEIGQQVELFIPALKMTLTGTVSEKDLIPTTLSYSYKVKVLINNGDKKLLSGMSCRIKMGMKDIKGVIVPTNAVQTRLDSQCIWVVKNGKATRKTVKSEDFASNGVLVSGDINIGDTIITAGYQRLLENIRVKVND